MGNEMTWRKAIEEILRKTPEAIHYKDVADEIVAKRLRRHVGATPAATVSWYLTTGLKKEGEHCPWQKVGRGLYVWKKRMDIAKPTPAAKEESLGVLQRDILEDAAKFGPSVEEEESEEQYEIISSFGMFWRREAIDWVSSPRILGTQQIGAEAVDFHRQIGIYLLYDGREVIYVGRATDRPLGKRLYEHTLDRFSSRWDRFSWFGLLPVSGAGSLGELPGSYVASKVIPAIEAILIEALEPRQNRKRGDDLSAAEYIQKEDPALRKKKLKQAMDDALSKVVG